MSIVAKANERLDLPVPEFALRNRKDVIAEILDDPDLMQIIERTAKEQGTSVEAVRDRAEHYASEIGPKFSAFFYFKMGYFLARWLIRLHFRVRAVAVNPATAADLPKDATVILVSNHRSNFDPLVVTYLASRRSTIALSAGEWARLWPFHHLIRASGAFVVDRSATDPLYHRVLATYLRVAVASGLHQGFFPEGELSRDGKMQQPKLGFLNHYCRAYSEVRDIVFVPVGINYDRIPEDRRLTHATGSFENPRSLFLIGSSLRYIASVLALPFRRRSHRFGNVCVAYGAPVSLRGWLGRNNIDVGEIRQPERLAWLPRFAGELMERCASQIPAPPVPLVAAVICGEQQQESWSRDELLQGLQRLLRKLEEQKAHPYVPGDVEEAVDFALELMQHNRLIQQTGGERYTVIDAELPVLLHYANTIAHLLP